MKFYFRSGGQTPGPLTRGLHILPLFFLALVLLTLGCSRRASPTSLVVTDEKISPEPAHVGPINISFRLTDSGKPVTGAQIALEGDMSHAGMAPVFAAAREASPGQYQGQLEFEMGGDWVVLMHITLPNGRTIEKQMDVRGVQSR